MDSVSHYASIFEEALQTNHVRFVGTEVLEPLSQWEIAPLTELLVLAIIKLDSEFGGGAGGRHARSLKERGYDDGISYARGRRFAQAKWDADASSRRSGPPLRNVHWFLGGLRQLGDFRNLAVVWFLVLIVPWFLGVNYIPMAFILLAGTVLAAPSLIGLVDAPTSVVLTLRVVAWCVFVFGCGSVRPTTPSVLA